MPVDNSAVIRERDMDAHAATPDIQTLRRIVATLMALAALAERAGSRCLPVRCFVLFLLRRVEAVAYAFVMETAQTSWRCLDEPPETRGRLWNAAWLAARFRALAAALAVQLRPGRPFTGRSARVDRAPQRPGRLPVTLGAWARKPNDTS